MTSEGKRNICVTAAVLLAFTAAVAVRVACAETLSPGAGKYRPVLVEESQSKAKCEAVADRIFVATRLGTECIAYFVTKGFESRRQAVLFFGGDASKEQYGDPAKLAADLAALKRMMQAWADKLRVRYVYVSRTGLQGSSGNHGERRRPKETFVMDAVVDGLKSKLGFDDIALAGQSGGATIAAALLTLGRKDVRCDVFGSGATELVDLEYDYQTKQGHRTTKEALRRWMYDPSRHLETIVRREDRRIFALADRSDEVVPFKYQAQFIDDLKAAGHLATLIEVEGRGPHHHGMERYVLPVAGACLNEVLDQSIVEAIARGRTWGQHQQALSQLGYQFKKWKPGIAPVALTKATGVRAD